MGRFLETAVFYWRDTIALKVPNVVTFNFIAFAQHIENKPYSPVPYNIDVKALMVIINNKYKEFP